jgi:hypothetical protein
MMNKLFCSFLLFASLAAADLTGKWTGSFDTTGPDGEMKQSTAYMDLKQNGSEVTGTAGPNQNRQWPIMKGKIDGDQITFEVQSDGPLMKFELRLVDEHLKGEAHAERDGKTMKAKLDLTKKTD